MVSDHSELFCVYERNEVLEGFVLQIYELNLKKIQQNWFTL